jgi:hypothetical protein
MPMNLVDLVKDQITSEVTGQLSSLLGGSEAQAKNAAGAAVPALLSALSGVASSGGGDKLASALTQFDSSSAGRIAESLAQKPGEVLDQGNSMLTSLLGGNVLSGIADAISRAIGFDSATIKKLLGYVAPFVMGSIASQFKGKPLTGQGLTQLFADQKSNIANALPSGLSLAGIPGLSDVSSAARSAAGSVQRAASAAPQAGASLARNLLPLGALVVLVALAWWYFKGRGTGETPTPAAVTQQTIQQSTQRPIGPSPQELADATQLGQDLSGVYTQATEALTFVTDEASAVSAAPRLEELNTRLDSLRGVWDRLPAAARTTVTAVTGEHLGKLKELIQTVLAAPGVKEKIGPTLDSIVTKLTALGGA